MVSNYLQELVIIFTQFLSGLCSFDMVNLTLILFYKIVRLSEKYRTYKENYDSVSTQKFWTDNVLGGWQRFV